jgi:hypothetical protein
VVAEALHLALFVTSKDLLVRDHLSATGGLRSVRSRSFYEFAPCHESADVPPSLTQASQAAAVRRPRA